MCRMVIIFPPSHRFNFNDLVISVFPLDAQLSHSTFLFTLYSASCHLAQHSACRFSIQTRRAMRLWSKLCLQQRSNKNHTEQQLKSTKLCIRSRVLIAGYNCDKWCFFFTRIAPMATQPSITRRWACNFVRYSMSGMPIALSYQACLVSVAYTNVDSAVEELTLNTSRQMTTYSISLVEKVEDALGILWKKRHKLIR